MNNFKFQLATNINEAVRSVGADERAMFVGGGTNLIDLWKYNIVNPSLLVDINHLDTGSGGKRSSGDVLSQLEDGGIRLNASATNADTAYHAIVEEQYPLLSKAILAGASAQIRNMATNGGNLLQRTRCHYFYDAHLPCNKRNPGSGCPAINGHNRMHAILGANDQCIAVFPSDMCVALAALDAVVQVTGVNSARSILFSDFHRLPGSKPELDNTLQHGEIITSIDLPPKGFEKNYSYLKIRDRHSYAFALVSVATAFELEGDIIKEARIALGGVAHKPWRIPEAESFLSGKPAIAENFEQAAGIILAGATGHRFNNFKIDLAKKAIIRNSMMALDPASQRPGAQPSE